MMGEHDSSPVDESRPLKFHFKERSNSGSLNASTDASMDKDNSQDISDEEKRLIEEKFLPCDLLSSDEEAYPSNCIGQSSQQNEQPCR